VWALTGDVLGDLSNSVLSEEDHNELRAAYVKLLDFTGMTFDGALRYTITLFTTFLHMLFHSPFYCVILFNSTYLCESGFRMPGEAQKIDRLLEAFCVGFCRDNPG
jgi:Sec7-like guanine-nucleotide exchange factor